MRVYHNAGGEVTESTKPFDSWPEHVRSRLVDDATLLPDEVPFLAFVPDNHRWTLVTSDRIAWKIGEAVRHVTIRTLRSANVPEDIAAKMSPEVKKSMKFLKIVAEDGNEAIVEFEQGRPFVGFWNLVKMMIAQQNRMVR
jgi:hypothetical protein